MASKPPKPRPRRKAKPRRRSAASARPPARRRAAAARTRKRAAGGKKTGGKKASKRTAPKAAGRKTSSRKTSSRKTSRRKTSRRKTTGNKATRRKTAARTAPTPAPKAPKAVRPAPRPRTAAPARRAKIPIGLLRERRTLREEPPHDDRQSEETRYSAAARTGQDELLEKLLAHTETGPVMTGGDLDGDWEHAYSSGDEAPGGDNPTPDQGRVDDNGKALGIHYDDNEQLRLGDKEAERDRHRWELDPASAEDYLTRDED